MSSAFPHGVASASGTAALHLALRALGVEAGRDVLVSDLTFVATANAVTYVGARPVFIDSDDRTWNIDPSLLADELHGTRASGSPAGRRDRRRSLRPVRGLRADPSSSAATTACRSSRTPPRRSGRRTAVARRDHSATSLCSRSTATRSSRRAAAGCSSATARTGSSTPVIWRPGAGASRHYEHEEVGFNYRLSNLLAALGRAQLQVLAAARRGSTGSRRSLPSAPRRDRRDRFHAGRAVRRPLVLADGDHDR